MDVLAKLLGGYDRVKIMRYFLFEGNEPVDHFSLAYHIKGKNDVVRKEVTALTSIGFLEKRKGKANVVMNKKGETKPREAVIYSLAPEFPHTNALKELLFDFKNIDKKEIAARFKQVGRIKLFVLAGIFVDSEKSRVDILLVGESLYEDRVQKVVDTLSAEMGRPVHISFMDTDEFEYRRKMYDKFIGDIFVMDHEVVINKIGVND